MPSLTAENYLKTIYHLLEQEPDGVTTNTLAASLSIKPATVTDMLRKLSTDKLVKHEKYYGVTLTDKGRKTALEIIRRHRLWEVFLAQKLQFAWDEVHDMAEQLEHVQSDELIERLDKFLGYPKTDPHGDPIPDKRGKISIHDFKPLCVLTQKQTGVISGVTEHSPSFLQYLEKNGLSLGNEIEVMEVHAFDMSADVKLNQKKVIHLSYDVTKNILIKQHGK
ncbi:MAG: metal-dependent transcriptional regulator [Bacteroidia bacterium]|nr:metal-dependent transcriptional regulator [Bacteroidia bacterium]